MTALPAPILRRSPSVGTHISSLISASSSEEMKNELEWLKKVEARRRLRERKKGRVRFIDSTASLTSSAKKEESIPYDIFLGDAPFGKVTPELMKQILIFIAKNNVPLKAPIEETITPLELRKMIRQSKEERQKVQHRLSPRSQIYQQLEEYQRNWEKKTIKKMIERIAFELEIPRRNAVRKSAMFMALFKENPYATLEYDEEYVLSVMRELGIPETELVFFKKLAINVDGLADLVEEFIGDYRKFNESIKKVTFVDLTRPNEPVKKKIKGRDDEEEEAPTNEAPTNEVPTNEAPTNEAPSNEAPKNEAPVKKVIPKKQDIIKMLKETTPRESVLKGALNLLMGGLYDAKKVIEPHYPTEKDIEKLSGRYRLNATAKRLKQTLEKDRLKSLEQNDPLASKTPYPKDWFIRRSQKLKKAYLKSLFEPLKVESSYKVVGDRVVLPRDVIVDVLTQQKSLLDRNKADHDFIKEVENARPIKLKHLGWSTPPEGSRSGPRKVYTNKIGTFKRIVDSEEQLYQRKLTMSEYRAKYHISVPLHFIPAGSAPRWKQTSKIQKKSSSKK